ncbi:DUF3237 family protein [uncultured Shimia sp.]|uniref:DUF3237 family protein n=1 Tax=uncultured Shimia sp. TaxID=573152 RepID=UPI00262D0106|nr:DUF3237 family protein [uncultured Shimia sp.]
MQIPVLSLSHSFTLRVELSTPLDLGLERASHRRIIPIVDGEAMGLDITGKVLNVGADWQKNFPKALPIWTRVMHCKAMMGR